MIALSQDVIACFTGAHRRLLAFVRPTLSVILHRRIISGPFRAKEADEALEGLVLRNLQLLLRSWRRSCIFD